MAVTGEDKPSLRSWYALAVLSLATLFGVVDRQILALMTEPIRQDLQLTDTSVGLLQGLGPGLFSALASVGLGWLADRMNRGRLLAICIVIWSMATAACGLAQTLPQLLLCTLAVALGEAGLTPVIYSLLPDLFPGRSRMKANFIYFGLGTVSVGIGMWLGGWVGALIDQIRSQLPASLSELATWRLTFFAVALPGPLIAAAVATIGAARNVAGGPAPSAFAFLHYFSSNRRTVIGVYAAAALYGFCFYALFAWGPVVIARQFQLAPAAIGQGLGVAVMIGSAGGVVLAMLTTRLLAHRSSSWVAMRVFQYFMIMTLIPCLMLPFIGEPQQVYLLLGLIAAGIYGGASVVPPLVQDITPAQTMGTALGVWMMSVAVVGNISPMVVGAISDRLVDRPDGLVWAFVAVCCPALMISALVMRLSEPSVGRTLIRIQSDSSLDWSGGLAVAKGGSL